MVDDNFFVRQGWQCPICKRVYSPDTHKCFYCGEGQANTYASDSTSFVLHAARAVSDKDRSRFDSFVQTFLDAFCDMTEEEKAEYRKVVDEQYKDTGININDLC